MQNEEEDKIAQWLSELREIRKQRDEEREELQQTREELLRAHRKITSYNVGFVLKNLDERIDALVHLLRATQESETEAVPHSTQTRLELERDRAREDHKNAILEVQHLYKELEKAKAASLKPEPSRLEIAMMMYASEWCKSVDDALTYTDRLIAAHNRTKES